ncbi:AGC/YANK protein kinase [Rhodotorula toruloides]|uniref:BY PROTMAP: gi/472588587/gb/EMS26059.1/ AGC/YANK protein kinase [Rhodosporidium toruloides NP11] gi/647396376/emb/CDR38506.1/ RHTO0S03e10264g1_1 [Rhodosporidium toruloides] n=1 Tax=Rhodotorula toruloides TaxID=5286 RepID=A0A0K3CBR7_RHOTO|nr:AGC/YANK protein kinase [Rhodotorula toruloides]PRQ77806.1 Protein kinase-like domain-containing protein [Rhodotorula toruloides]
MGALCCKPEEVDFDGPVDLWHFYLLRSVGKGAFGKVRVVQHKKTKALYALKYINKARISKQRAVNNIIQERRLLEEIDSPFVCNLRFAFQDDENLFMVLDLMLGGDLRFHLDRLGSMKEDWVKFYVAEMALALGDLHKRGIVHRDIKPDNILLDEKGHAHLTDFNIAVHFTERRALTSVAGSMAYMAPEVLAKRGYFATVDWWSLGVVAYELLFGKRPYRGKTNSTLTQAILKEQVRFPENVEEIVSPEGLDCIKGLLQRDPKKRLGCPGTGGLEAFKRHPWFRDYDWDVLERKEAIPPFEPDSKKANFDATHELEELLLEDNPLKARKRNPNIDLSELSADYRLMEQHFLPYDYLRQPRKSWFVLDESGTAASAGVSSSTRGVAAESSAGAPRSPAMGSDAGVHPQAVRIDEQPLADLTATTTSVSMGRVTPGPHEGNAGYLSSSPARPRDLAGRPDDAQSTNSAGRASPMRQSSRTPVEGQSFEMREQRSSPQPQSHHPYANPRPDDGIATAL